MNNLYTKSVIWKKVKIPGFSFYLISNFGTLYNTKTGRNSIGTRLNGALQFSLYNKGKVRTIMAHKLVITHFQKKQLHKDFVLHIDFDQENNNNINLKQITRSELYRSYRRKADKVRGVYKFPYGVNTRWRAVISLSKGKSQTLGYFRTKSEAMRAYWSAYCLKYGEPPGSIEKWI